MAVVGGGRGVGAAGGLGIGRPRHGVGRLVLYLRKTHREAVGLDNFLALGLLALAYGVAVLAGAWGFLAAFAAGSALRHVERRETSQAVGVDMDDDDEDDAPPSRPWPRTRGGMTRPVATTEEIASPSAPCAGLHGACHAALQRADRAHRRGGDRARHRPAAVGGRVAPSPARWLIVLLFVVVRPLAVAARAGRLCAASRRPQRRLIGWFGIRGIGSLYYLMYAVNHGLDPSMADVADGDHAVGRWWPRSWCTASR